MKIKYLPKYVEGFLTAVFFFIICTLVGAFILGAILVVIHLLPPFLKAILFLLISALIGGCLLLYVIQESVDSDMREKRWKQKRDGYVGYTGVKA